jgi:phenylalanyl-tRNA synthetase beta chain
MVGPGDLEAFHLDSEERLDIRNPIGVQTSCLRPSLIPGVAKVLAGNEFNGQEGTAVFEIGKVFLKSAEEPREPYKLAIGLSGVRQPRSWYSKAVDFDLYDLKGIVEMLADLAGVRLEARGSDHKAFHPGRQMEVVLSQGGAETSLGWLGEILPSITGGLGSKRRAYVAEIDLAPLLESAATICKVREVPKHPAVKRDIAVVVPEAVRESDVRKVIIGEGGDLMETVEVFDLYRGEQIPEGTKSLAYGMMFRSESRTLKEEEVDSIQKRIEQRLGKEFGAKIRDKQAGPPKGQRPAGKRGD